MFHPTSTVPRIDQPERTTLLNDRGTLWIDWICCRTNRSSEDLASLCTALFSLSTSCFCWHVALNLSSQLLRCLCCQRTRDWESCSRERKHGLNCSVLYFSITVAVWNSSGGLVFPYLEHLQHQSESVIGAVVVWEEHRMFNPIDFNRKPGTGSIQAAIMDLT